MINIYFDKTGMPIDLLTWGRLFEDREYATIGKTEVGPYVISTVWIGIDHSWNKELHIFETMIFSKDKNDLLDQYQARYATEQQAIQGHEDAVGMASVQVRLVEEHSKQKDQAHQPEGNDLGLQSATSDPRG